MKLSVNGRRTGFGTVAALAAFVLASAAPADPQSPAPPGTTTRTPGTPAKTAPPSSSKAAPGSQGSGVVARVNGRPVLRRDFDLAVQVEFRRRGPDERRHDDLEAVRTAVLDKLIDNELLYQKASQSGITVADADVRQEVEHLKTGLGTPEEASAFMKEVGITEKDLTDQVRRTLVVSRFAEREVTGGVTITDAQAHAWYDSHPEEVRRPEAVRISQIVVQVPPGAGAAARATARQKSEAILQELRTGKDFGEMARLHSDGPEAKRDGDSGWIWSGGGALPAVEHAALQLQPGQTTDIIESLRGFHIIKATARRPAGPIPFDEMRDRIVARLKDQERDARLKAYVDGLRKTAKIEKLA